MNPADLPGVSKTTSIKFFTGLRKWLAGLNTDRAFEDDDVYSDQEAPPLQKQSNSTQGFSRTSSESGIGTPRRPGGGLQRNSSAVGVLQRSSTVDKRHKSKTAVLSSSAADKFLGTAATATGHRERLPPFIIHPLDLRYRFWWYTTVVIAAITAILEPYVIAFTAPGLYPYGSASSIMEYICIAVVGIDMVVSFNVARYHNGVLVTNRRRLARNYMRLIFWVDLFSVIPFDEVALAIAGINGAKYVNNPELAQYLSLLKLIRMLRMYRLSWFFSYLTYNLAAPLLMVNLTRNLFATFFLANLSACAFYFEARQAGFAGNTWVGVNLSSAGVCSSNCWFDGAGTAQMYIYSLYWAVITLATVGYGDIHAYNAVEAGMISFWVMFVFFYTAYIIGSVTLLVVKGDKRMGKYREQMRALQNYSAVNNLPEDLRESMLRHLKLHFYNSQSSDEIVLQAYPSTIRRRVLRQLYLSAVRSVYLFTSSKQRFLDALLALARVELYLPQVEVLAESDFVNELFIVVAGELACTRSPLSGGGSSDIMLEDNASVRGGRTRLLQEGDVFGEIAFFTGTAQTETVTTLSTVRVLSISKTAYEQCAHTFRDSARNVLTQLAQQAERATQDEFPGVRGHQLYTQVMASDLMRRSRSEAATSTAALTGGDPTWRLPAGAAAALHLSAHQEAAVGNLVRVQAVVSQYVAKHDEDRVMEWLYSASRGDNAKLREMLDHGFDPDSADYDARCALMLAAAKGYRETVALLLEAGADPNATDTFGGTALWEASKGRHDECIDLLRREGARLGKQGVSEASLLCTAVFEGDLTLLRRLLRAGAHADVGDYDKRTALHIAAAEGNLAAVELLVNSGATVSLRDRWGASAADEAERVGATAVVAFLHKAEQAAKPPSPGEKKNS